MKRVILISLFFSLVCSVPVAAENETMVIDCSKQPLSEWLTEDVVGEVTQLVLSGSLTPEDLSLINTCSQLTVLDLTDAELSTIPEKAFSSTSIKSLLLPKEIESFNLNAVPLYYYKQPDTRILTFVAVEVTVTGNFPLLYNPAIIVDPSVFNSPMEFRLAEGNDRYVEKKNCIFTKDMNTLLKAGHIFHVEDRYGGSEVDKANRRDYFDVEKIAPCAFAYSTVGMTSELTFSDRLKSIGAHAFDCIMKDYDDPDPGLGIAFDQSWYSSIILEGYTAPSLDGDVFNTPAWSRYFRVVPYVKPFVESNIQWAGSMDTFDYGVLKGYEYAPNHCLYIDYIEWVYEQNVKAYGIVENNDTTVMVNVDMEVPMSVTATVHNGSTGEMEEVTAPINDGSAIVVNLRILDSDNKEMAAVARECHPGEKITCDVELPFVPKNDICNVETSIENENCADVKKNVATYRISYMTTGLSRTPWADDQDGVYYDLRGVKRENPGRGIYITNGKKVLVR